MGIACPAAVRRPPDRHDRVLLALKPFKDPFPWQATTRISTGAFAGISTDTAGATRIAETSAAAERWVEPGDGVLLYGLAGEDLLTRGDPVTNMMWMGNFGSANQHVVDAEASVTTVLRRN